MSDNRFRFDPALEATLAHDPVPGLPAGFADRIIAAAQERAPPLPASLPQPPRTRSAGASRWRSARRLVVGTAAFGALAGAAAASGLLGDLPVSIPSASAMWEAITGERAGSPASAPAPKPVASPSSPRTLTEILATPIRDLDKLEQTYRKIDQLREERSGQRRERVDARLDEALERRRALGLPAPTPEQEREIKQRIDGLRQRSDAVIEQNQLDRRSEQRERIEQGETLTGEDLVEDVLQDTGRNAPPAVRERLDDLRALPPEQRVQRLRGVRERVRDRTTPPAAPLRGQTPTASSTETPAQTQADQPPSQDR